MEPEQPTGCAPSRVSSLPSGQDSGSYSSGHRSLYEGPTSAGVVAGLLLTLAFAGSAASIWLQERLGGILLTIEGLILILAYPQAAGGLPTPTIDAVIITLALPPLVAGALCLACRRH